jgi:hypothetical protein
MSQPVLQMLAACGRDLIDHRRAGPLQSLARVLVVFRWQLTNGAAARLGHGPADGLAELRRRSVHAAPGLFVARRDIGRIPDTKTLADLRRRRAGFGVQPRDFAVLIVIQSAASGTVWPGCACTRFLGALCQTLVRGLDNAQLAPPPIGQTCACALSACSQHRGWARWLGPRSWRKWGHVDFIWGRGARGVDQRRGRDARRAPALGNKTREFHRDSVSGGGLGRRASAFLPRASERTKMEWGRGAGCPSGFPAVEWESLPRRAEPRDQHRRQTPSVQRLVVLCTQ